MPPPELYGYTVRRLAPADAPALQALYERCSDYHEEHEGVPTRPNAAEEELVARPPGRMLSDKFSFGIYAPTGEMVGYLDLMRDFPSAGEWWIALLMLDPGARGAGLGGRVYEAASRWVAAEGGHTISLGVLEHSPRAEQFWRRMGFEEAGRQPYTSDSAGRERRLIVLRHELVHPPAA
ncbi:MAG TPA: GNAT family N-acetyltransferase [Longimicrobiaceae bacterium]|nr:GNAT family N-acetyltransferase [Longimicrobiaceae bacterium]